MSAHYFSDKEQNDSSHGKLCSAEYYRRHFSGKNINQYCRHSIRKLRDQDKSFSRKLKSCIQGISHQIDHNDACKTQDTSDHLSSCHTFLTENKTG